MIEWSLAAFAACESVAAVVVAAPPELVDDASGRLTGMGGEDDLTTVVAGGATRAQSVANALAAVGTELVAIHDAARPLITPDLIEAIIATLAASPQADAAIPATPITDTVKQVPPGSRPIEPVPIEQKMDLAVESTLDRSRLWAAQTPQVFRADALRGALDAETGARESATDEAMLVEAAGGTVLIHPAPAQNLKVTTPLDLEVAELLLGRRS